MTRAQELLRNLAAFADDLHSAEFLYSLAEVQNYVEENPAVVKFIVELALTIDGEAPRTSATKDAAKALVERLLRDPAGSLDVLDPSAAERELAGFVIAAKVRKVDFD